MSSARRFRSFLVGAIALLIAASPAHALSLIRDAEIESTLRRYGDPLFKAAGLNPQAVHIFIVRDDNINAFVAGGANIFIHTGLIRACETPDMLIGVIAHETGHIAGGHLARGTEKLRNAQLGAILTYVLGAAAGVGSGKGDVAAAVITGGQSTLQRNLLSFSRANEQAADQAALTFLDETGISASGMVRMFATLRRNETQRGGSPDPYLLTHPLSGDRITHVENHVEHSSIPEGQVPADFPGLHRRLLAKLGAFIDTPEKTLQRYPINDKNAPARMARAIAYYKMPDLDRALAEMDDLIAASPNDAFLHELKGQIFFENGRIEEALAAYDKAASLKPDSALILTSLAEVEIATGKPARLHTAITHLERAASMDNTNSQLWRLLATAYGKNGEIGKSSLALAEEAALGNDGKPVARYAKLALSQLKSGTPAYLRALDLKNTAQQMQDREKDE